MATVDLTFGRANEPTGAWVLPSNALADDGAYATTVASSTSYLKLDRIAAGLPQDITISSVQILCGARLASGSANTYLNAAFSYDGVSIISSTASTSALTTTELPYVLGSGLWGLDRIRQPKINQNDFSVFLWPGGTHDYPIMVDYVTLRVTYTANSYLRGERSDYPESLDSIPRVSNGISPANRIRSEQVNRLGDCLYQIQSHILDGSQSQVKAIGAPPGQKMVMFTITVTGTVASPASIVYFNCTRKGIDSVPTVNSNLGSPQGSQPVFVNTKCDFVSAFGWVQTATGLVPVHVTARPLFSKKFPSGRSPGEYSTAFSFGFTAVPVTLYDSLLAGSNQGYHGLYVDTASVPAGTMVVKIMAIGELHE